VAYSAATGGQLWVSRYNGPASKDDIAHSVAVSPGGGTVFATGVSDGRRTKTDYATVAYSAATGRRLWARRYNGSGNGYDAAVAMAVSPAGGRVFVTGYSQGRATGEDYATVAYSAATGRQLWASRYHAHDGATAVAVSPDGTTVYVAGHSRALCATVAYGAATGRQQWASRSDAATPRSVAVSPGGRRVFVTGWDGPVYTTVAYRG
jgi:outer membrane protein assembly factor BamB